MVGLLRCGGELVGVMGWCVLQLCWICGCRDAGGSAVRFAGCSWEAEAPSYAVAMVRAIARATQKSVSKVMAKVMIVGHMDVDADSCSIALGS